MPHEIDITAGVASFANARSDHWHRLGQSVGHAMTAREALDAAHLAGWNVRKMPLQVPQQPVINEDGVTTPDPLAVPDYYAVVPPGLVACWGVTWGFVVWLWGVLPTCNRSGERRRGVRRLAGAAGWGW